MRNKSQGAGHQSVQEPKLEAPPLSAPTPVDKISAARAAVQYFLATELGAREVRITKIAPVDNGLQGWFAEAEILLPNLEIKTLGLDLAHEILEQAYYSG